MKKSTLIVLLALSMVCLLAGAAFAVDIDVHYRIVSTDDNGWVVIDDQTVTVPAGSTVFKGLKRACWGSDEVYQSGGSEIPMVYSGSGAGCYVSSINNRAAAYYTYWDGWMYRVNDEMIDYSCDDPTYAVLSDGDYVTWYYAEPERTMYPKIDAIWKDGDTVKVRVQEDHFTDIWNWIRQGFADAPGVYVSLEYNGTPLTPDETDANGIAEFAYQGGGDYKAWVAPTWENSGSYEGLPEYVKSWSLTETL